MAFSGTVVAVISFRIGSVIVIVFIVGYILVVVAVTIVVSFLLSSLW